MNPLGARAQIVHLLVYGDDADLVLDDLGRPVVCQLRPLADLVALHLDHRRVPQVRVLSRPVGDLGAMFDDAGLSADDLILFEATTTSPDDAISWAYELAQRIADRIHGRHE